MHKFIIVLWYFYPIHLEATLNVICRGVRGSIPVPGAHTSRYGGNSSCVEVRAKDGPPLVLDCGTGARALGLDLLKERVEHVEVFTHFHMDHLFGFPFFGPIYSPSCTLNVNLPSLHWRGCTKQTCTLSEIGYHPVRIADLPSRTQFSWCSTRNGRRARSI